MAVSFKNTKGKAQSSKVDLYKYKDGENTVRLHGGVLPRYMYWVTGTNDKDIPIECLAFDRDKEKFNNVEVDHVPSFYPDLKCSWSYAVNCIDPSDGKSKVLPLKKKMFEQIMNAAEDLGDPTDPEDGWDVVFKRTKTGPLPFNVEYTVQVLRCKKRPLTDAERQAIAEDKTIDEKYPRQTPEEVLALLEKIASGGEESESGSQSEQEAARDLS